ncbi:MAG: peptide-methionine (R)-S-oxide reductase, partial [Anaeromyxobacteraceae bacterium]
MPIAAHLLLLALQTTPAVPALTAHEQGSQMSTFQRPADEELRKRLTPEQYEVTQHEGTEPPFRNEFWDN